MCGLVGLMSSDFQTKHKDVLSCLLFLDTFRGDHSTGVAAVRHNTDTAIMKSTVPGYEFVQGPALDQHLKLNDFLWIGHNRFGTVGKTTKSNAHPFCITDDQGSPLVVGAHNGTLKNKYVLKDHQSFGTDSEALYNNIAHEGIEATIPKVEGAWALTFYDHGEDEFQVIRNKERPLHYAWSEDKKTLFWSSEVWMLRVAVSRSNIKLHEDKIYSFEEDTLYCFDAPENRNSTIELTRTVGGLVGKTPTFFQGTTTTTGTAGGGSTQQQAAHPQRTETNQASTSSSSRSVVPFKDQQTQATSTAPFGTRTSSTGGKQPQTNETGSTERQSGGTVANLADAKRFRGYQGLALSRTELLNHLAGGCSWCEREFIDPKDRHAWLAPAKPICQKCLDGVPDVGEHESEDDANLIRLLKAAGTVH